MIFLVDLMLGEAWRHASDVDAAQSEVVELKFSAWLNLPLRDTTSPRGELGDPLGSELSSSTTSCLNLSTT